MIIFLIAKIISSEIKDHSEFKYIDGEELRDMRKGGTKNMDSLHYFDPKTIDQDPNKRNGNQMVNGRVQYEDLNSQSGDPLIAPVPKLAYTGPILNVF